MKRTNRLLIGVAAAAFFGACASDETPFTPGLLNTLLGATLTGAAEKPNAITTTASGTANLTIIDTNTIRVQTIVSSIDSVTQAHIHAGDASIAGPVMVFLAGPFSSTVLVARGLNSVTTLNGVLSHVDVTRSSTFLTPFTFDSVLFRVRNGTAYVNVHTRKNPGGEIRGQVTAK